jgi:hypothetical protein
MAAKLEVHEVCPFLIPQDSSERRYDGYITARVSSLYLVFLNTLSIWLKKKTRQTYLTFSSSLASIFLPNVE